MLNKKNNFIRYFLLSPILIFLFIYVLYIFKTNLNSFSIVYFIFLLIFFLIYDTNILFIINSIFSIIALIALFFPNLQFKSFLFFEIIYSWIFLYYLVPYHTRKNILNNRLKLTFEQTEANTKAINIEYEKDKNYLSILKGKLNKYYRLSNTIKYFTDNLKEKEIEKLLLKSIKEIVPNADIRIINKDESNIFTNWIQKRGNLLFIENLKEDYRFSEDITKKFQFNSLILVPLMSYDGIYSFIEITSSKSNFFTEDDLRMVLIISDTASITISTSNLFEKKKELVRIDPLTGIYNRKSFFDLFSNELKRSFRYKKSLSLIIIDIDYFKKCNDIYGHLYGDEILKSVVATLKKRIREIDIIARYGGEEFVILLPVSLEIAYKKAEDLRICIANECKVTVSMGVACSKLDITINEFLDLADKALYEAKNQGRNKVVCRIN